MGDVGLDDVGRLQLEQLAVLVARVNPFARCDRNMDVLRGLFQCGQVFGWNWLKKFTLGLHGRTGYAVGFDAGRGLTDVPPAERFFMGGTDTVRGYFDRSLGASVRGGGRFLLLTNVEYGFRPVEPLKLRAFYDSGNTWDDIG